MDLERVEEKKFKFFNYGLDHEKVNLKDIPFYDLTSKIPFFESDDEETLSSYIIFPKDNSSPSFHHLTHLTQPLFTNPPSPTYVEYLLNDKDKESNFEGYIKLTDLRKGINEESVIIKVNMPNAETLRKMSQMGNPINKKEEEEEEIKTL